MHANVTPGVPREEPPTLSGALDRMVDAAQQVVVDQVVLARLDLQAVIARTARDGALVVGGGTVLLVAWIFAMIALHGILVQWLHPAASLGAIAGGNALIGGTLVGLGAGRLARSGQGGRANGHT